MKQTSAVKPLSYIVNGFSQRSIESFLVDRLKTGFSQLDTALGGGITAGMTVLGAVSGLGKSTFALQLAQNVAKTGIPVLFFSLEMTTLRIASKSISRQLFLNHSTDASNTLLAEAGQLLNREFIQSLDKDSWNYLERSKDIVFKETENLYIIDGSSDMRSATDICNYVKEFMKNNASLPAPLVIVDYLQILSSESQTQRGDSKYVVDYNIRELKKLSAAKNLPLILISSLNRASYNVPIQLTSFKESGNIEYSADTILALQFSAVHNNTNNASSRNTSFNMEQEKSKDPRDVEIVILKQRYGPSGDFPISLMYHAKYDCFIENKNNSSEENDCSKKTNINTHGAFQGTGTRRI